LDQLDQLVLRGNNFRNLNRVDIFEGFKGSLQRLDLSDNMLMNLPSGSLLGITSSLTELILAGNIFHTDLLDADDFEAMPSPVPEKYNFTNLRILDLSRTQLKTFKGIWIAKLTKLIRLDISCNNFKQVSKSFFTSLPSTLQKLNMSFCVSTLPDAPRIDLDAFSTIGKRCSADQ
jgi:Leucine-rich repeat (LRR) protein